MKIRPRVSRTKESAKQELLEFYNEHGIFTSHRLMAEISGLERYLRVQQGGVRNFCEKHEISYILEEAKLTRWNDELASETLKKVYEKYQQPIGLRILTQEGLNKLYQWISKKNGSLENFCKDNDLEYLLGTLTMWNDAKCFRLIKDLFLQKMKPVSPEDIKKTYKGAHGYIYKQYGNVEKFTEAFDLTEYIDVRPRIDDDYAIKRIKEAFSLKKDCVNPLWLMQNGFYSIYEYILDKGNGSWMDGCETLGLSQYAMTMKIHWDDEKALKVINEMYEQKKDILISVDFEKFNQLGLRYWISEQYGTLEDFFEVHGLSGIFANMAHVGRELWSYGLKYQYILKDIVELLFEDVIYDKWIENLKVRPDFVLGNTGTWIDAKLSSFAYFTDQTVEKYTARKECQELWLVYLRGHEFRVDNPKVRVFPVKNWYSKLEQMGKHDIISKLENLKIEVAEIEAVSKKPR